MEERAFRFFMEHNQVSIPINPTTNLQPI